MKTSVLIDHEPVADGGFLVRALLRIEGDPPDDKNRIPLNLSLVLDRSGSMWGEKLVAARRAAAGLVKRLWPADTASVVAFDDDVTVVAAPATGDAQEGLADRIESIGPGGCTNLSGGWLRARELLAENTREGGVNRVILLTDGLANVGITDPGALVGLCRDSAAKGFSTTTIGFGEDYDEDLLKTMADAGGGGTYYIEEIDQAVGIFEEELEGLMSLAAQNVRVTVKPGEGSDSVNVLHEYPSHAEGETLTLEIGDLYGREPRKILMEFLLPPTDDDREIEVAQVGVVASVITPDGGVEIQTISLPLRLCPVAGGKVEPEVRKEILMVEAARLRTEALELRDAGDHQGASESLRAYADTIRHSDFDDQELRQEVSELEESAGLFEARSVSMKDIKYMKQRAYSSMRSRHQARKRIERED
jgi:Ca-activated chloride channel family protein